MKHFPKRVLAALLSGALCLSLTGPGRGVEPSVDLLEVTTGSYTCENPKIQSGGLYTLIALRRGAVPAQAQLTAPDLLAADPLFFGSAVAAESGRVTFPDVRLRTAESVEYFVTGPGLDTPIREATSQSTSLSGSVTTTCSSDKSASVSLVDAETGYAYAGSAAASPSGHYAFESIAPASYHLQVLKPGYLPYTGATAIHVDDTDDSILPALDISDYVGDVNGDRVRSNADLLPLLLHYNQTQGWSAPVAPDLNTDGVVDAQDIALLPGRSGIQLGETDPAAPPTLSVTDETVGGALHKLVFALSGGSTFSAGTFSLSYRLDSIRPCTSGGGAVTVPDPTAASRCLAVNPSISQESALWSLDDTYATLSFSLTAPALEIGETLTLAEFYYKPASGSVSDLFSGVFQLPLARALVGRQTVVECDAEHFDYPGSSNLNIVSLSIDQSSTELLIPTVGQTTSMFLSATGVDIGGEVHQNLTGVMWTLTSVGNPGFAPAGLSVSNGLLSVSSMAAPGEITVTAKRDERVSDPITITLKAQPSVVTALEFYRGAALCTSLRLTSPDGGQEPLVLDLTSGDYVLRAYDQYGSEMSAPPAVDELTWTLSGAPAGVTLRQGVLTVPGGLPSGNHTFSLRIAAGAAQTSVRVTVSVESRLAALVVSGPQSANIPSSGSISLTYTVTGLDSQGNPMPSNQLNPDFQLVNGTESVTASREVEGNVVVVRAGATPGVYFLQATQDGVESPQFPLTLSAQSSAEIASYAALYRDGELAGSAALSCDRVVGCTAAFSAKLLGVSGVPVPGQPAAFTWTLSGAPEGVRVENGLLTVPAGLAAQTYHFTLSAADPATGLSAVLPIELAVRAAPAALELAGPPENTLTIPAGADLNFTFSVVGATDASGSAVTPPSDLTWSVAYVDGKPLTGVSIDPQTGALTLQSVAMPGALTVTAASGALSASLTVNLAVSAQTSYILKLYRDGQPVSGFQDQVRIKEGAGETVLDYTAVVIDQATQQPVQGELAWLNGLHTFTVGADATPGLYDTIITAVYEQRSVSVHAQVLVYPNIALAGEGENAGYRLEIDWGDQSLEIPVKGTSPTYRGSVVAVTTSGQRIPLSQLPDSYTLTVDTPIPGVYPSYDAAAHTLLLTVDSTAARAYEDGSTVQKVLGLTLSYFPGETGHMTRLPLEMVLDVSVPTRATILRGQGAGSSFAFTTPDRDTLSVTPGSFTNCYALQLIDQYGQAVTGQKITWSLEGNVPEGLALKEPSFAGQYINYTSVVRLEVGEQAAPGAYQLTLVASGAGLTAQLPLDLTVAGEEAQCEAAILGAGQVTIPSWFTGYNNPNGLNETPVTGSYTLSLINQFGHEMDTADREIAWSVTDHAGTPLTAQSGVTWTVQKDHSMTLSVSRLAQPAEGETRHLIQAADPVSGKTATLPLELNRGVSAPLVLVIVDEDGKPVSKATERYTAVSGHTSSGTYTAKLLDNYNQAVDNSGNAYPITWSNGTLPRGVTFQNGQLTIAAAKSVTAGSFTVTAKCRLIDPVRGPQEIKDTFTISVALPGTGTTPGGNTPGGNTPGGNTPGGNTPGGNTPGGNTPGGNTPGGNTPGGNTPGGNTPGGNTPGGNTPGGNTPGGNTPGGDPVTQPPQVVDPVAQTVYPALNQTGDVGAATLTPQEEETLLGATSAGAVTIAPTGGGNATTVNVTVTNNTLGTLATQLRPVKVQTGLGAVILSPQALNTLSAQTAGTTTTISVSKGADHTFSIAFQSGETALDVPLGSITLNAVDTGLSGNGNVVKRVDSGLDQLIPKALVDGGRVIVSLTGPAQMQIISRNRVFDDTQSHWAAGSISFVTARDLFLGTSPTSFTPAGEMTRSMVVTVLHRLENTPQASGNTSYSDVPPDIWYTNAVSWADSYGIVQGSGGSFSPDAPVSREQLATILYRYVQVIGGSAGTAADLSTFPDGSEVSDWAREAMEWAVSVQLINGKGDGSLDPLGNASRAEVATILERLIRLLAPSV